MGKQLAIFGSTGSIGTQALEVVSHLGGFDIVLLTAGRRWELLAEQVIRFKPDLVVLSDREAGKLFLDRVRGFWRGELRLGEDEAGKVAGEADYDIALNALVGVVGLMPSYQVLRRGKRLALANKESLVLAGELLTRMARETSAEILPVDSEHCALFQCLLGEDISTVKRLILTASGGPFRDLTLDETYYATPEQALSHPTWQMGPKITIDSATLMNKGLEIIEAHYLFGIGVERIEVRLHPQSIVHSLVQFVDGSFKAQLSKPDMRLPIQYALTYPRRLFSQYIPDDPVLWGEINFAEVPPGRFPCLELAVEAVKAGETYCAVLNGADEAAVGLYLQRAIPFGQIPELIKEALDGHRPTSAPTLEDLMEADRWGRQFVEQRVKASSSRAR